LLPSFIDVVLWFMLNFPLTQYVLRVLGEKMPTIQQARQYASLLRRSSRPGTLHQAILFGSIAEEGSGNDLDLIIEVPKAVFLKFAQEYPKEYPNDLWMFQYNCPRCNRLTVLFKVLGIESKSTRKRLEKTVVSQLVDVLCLPQGWEKPGYVSSLMKTQFNLGHDPNMLSNILASTIVLQPSVLERWITKMCSR
jgi:hypothetical protein